MSAPGNRRPPADGAPRTRRIAAALALGVATAAGAELLARTLEGELIERGTPNAIDTLASLSPNRWHELYTRAPGWSRLRADHGGAVYDSERNSVLLFGSDTHLHDFDNSVRELRLDDARWYRLYERSPRYTLRTNADGVRVAGGRGDMPWPMHVYDAMLYDPSGRQVVVLSGDKHNFVPAPGAQTDPIWAYRPKENRWRILNASGLPNFFAAGAVYDPTRDAIVGYGSLADTQPFLPLAGESTAARTGVWELGPDRVEWHLVSTELHHWGWFNAEFDVANRAMVVFGGHEDDPSIWMYRVGGAVGEAGSWERRRPAGDDCPGGYYFPAAYDRKREITLYLPFDRRENRTVTCAYDASRNIVRRLPAGGLPSTRLNYTMVYAAQADVFVLVTGSFSRNDPTRVWVMRPDLGVLRE